ncbi:hypothetical protein GCM10023197_17020 [Gordonia humi]
MAIGQQYPALGYGPDGAPRYAYRQDPPAEQTPDEPVQQYAPPPTPPGDPRRRTLLGAASVVVLVLLLFGAFKLVSGDDDSDRTAVRDDTPVSQNTTDPYLPKAIEPTDEVPGETTRPAPAAVEADLDVEAAPGSAILYIDGDGVKIARTPVDGKWSETIRTSTGLLQLRVIPGPGAPASCTITVDGEAVAHDELPADAGGSLACEARG